MINIVSIKSMNIKLVKSLITVLWFCLFGFGIILGWAISIYGFVGTLKDLLPYSHRITVPGCLAFIFYTIWLHPFTIPILFSWAAIFWTLWSHFPICIHLHPLLEKLLRHLVSEYFMKLFAALEHSILHRAYPYIRILCFLFLE